MKMTNTVSKTKSANAAILTTRSAQIAIQRGTHYLVRLGCAQPRHSWLIHSASILQYVGPLAACCPVAVFQMLAKMVCPVELLGAVTLPKLMIVLEMVNTLVPVLVRGIAAILSCRVDARPHKFFTAVSTGVSFSGPCCRLEESPVVTGKIRT